MIPVAAGVAGAALSLWALLLAAGTTKFQAGGCARLEGFLNSHIVGQELAISQLVDAVCVHLDNQTPRKPLVISVHGPPGVGKTYTHTLLARALYNKDPSAATRCPGVDCLGAKVIYGLDFTHEAQDGQLAAVRASIIDHVRSVKDPVLVIEEADKLDCSSRGMLRQLLQHPELVEGGYLARAVVLLENNLGFSELEELLTGLGGNRRAVRAEAAEKLLREAVFASWQRQGCEEYADTLKLLSLVDFFLPFLPLQREQVQQLVVLELRWWAQQLWWDRRTRMRWDDEVVAFLSSMVEFDGPYPLEGAKQVHTVATRYLARISRRCPMHDLKGKDEEAAPMLVLSLTRGEDGAQPTGLSGRVGDYVVE